jgi:hypothetical protein
MLSSKNRSIIDDILKNDDNDFSILLQYNRDKRAIGFLTFGKTIKDKSKATNLGNQIQNCLIYNNVLILPD